MGTHSKASLNQDKLIRQLPDNSLFWVFAPPSPIRNYDVEHPFRQDSDFTYLTGQDLTPGIWAIYNYKSKYTRTLFYTPKPESNQRWVGKDVSLNQLKNNNLWDEVKPYEDFLSWLSQKALNTNSIYLPLHHVCQNTFNILKHALTRRPRNTGLPPSLNHIYTLMAPLRQIKTKHEILCMKKAAEISSKAHAHVMSHTRPNMTELDIAALFESKCRSLQSHQLAYPSIVATSENATVLHYAPSNRSTKKGDCILIDAGCEWQYYASDITRVFPIGKKFSPAQRDIYTLVLEVQKNIIKMVKPGIRYDQLQEKTISLITQGLKDLKVLKGSLDDLIESKAYDEYYYHSVSHFLGLDVHDTGPYRDSSGKSIKLKPGMVLTIEPGIYFYKKGGKYLGIGVRIEDDILVTKSGHDILSKKAPKEISAIESLRS
jgi:Xaa-Pro aminopeptidase